MNISGEGTWLSGNICHSIPTDYISSQEVSRCKSQNYLGPACYVGGLVTNLKWEVPHYSLIGLLAFVRMLRNSLFGSLYNKNKLVNNLNSWNQINLQHMASSHLQSLFDKCSKVHHILQRCLTRCVLKWQHRNRRVCHLYQRVRNCLHISWSHTIWSQGRRSP